MSLCKPVAIDDNACVCRQQGTNKMDESVIYWLSSIIKINKISGSGLQRAYIAPMYD